MTWPTVDTIQAPGTYLGASQSSGAAKKIKPADDFRVAEPTPKKPFYTSLFFQLGVAIVAGVLIGHFLPKIGSELRPLGDGFIMLIKMIIAPLIFLVIVTGIAAVGDVKAVGRVGVKALLYFTCATVFALVFGLIIANVFQPGAGLSIDPSTLDAGAIEEKSGRPRARPTSSWESFRSA